VSASSARFLHIEQALTLRDDDNGDGWFWGDIRDALLATWPECMMNNGAVDCTLGPSLSQPEGLTCTAAGRASLGIGAARARRLLRNHTANSRMRVTGGSV